MLDGWEVTTSSKASVCVAELFYDAMHCPCPWGIMLTSRLVEKRGAPVPPVVCQCWAIPSELWLNSVGLRPRPVDIGPNLADPGSASVQFNRICGEAGRARAKRGRNRAEFGRLRSSSWQGRWTSGRIWPTLGQLRSNATKSGAKRAERGPSLAIFGQFWSKSGSFCPIPSVGGFAGKACLAVRGSSSIACFILAPFARDPICVFPSLGRQGSSTQRRA